MWVEIGNIGIKYEFIVPSYTKSLIKLSPPHRLKTLYGDDSSFIVEVVGGDEDYQIQQDGKQPFIVPSEDHPRLRQRHDRLLCSSEPVATLVYF